jgi:hypothetical protein
MEDETDDLYYVERAARHLHAALDSFLSIPDKRMTRDLWVQRNRMQLAENRLLVIRNRMMKRHGVTVEDMDEWDTP